MPAIEPGPERSNVPSPDLVQDGPISTTTMPVKRSPARARMLTLKRAYSRRARQQRARIFQRLFPTAMNQLILDLGGGDGSHIAMVVPGHTNVTIADIDRKKLAVAESRYGHKSCVLEESEGLPFGNGEFDIVFCSSVIEHITGPKNVVGNIWSRRVFEAKAGLTSRNSPMKCGASAKDTLCRPLTNSFR